jgi:hypothetical protein
MHLRTDHCHHPAVETFLETQKDTYEQYKQEGRT